MWRRRRGARPPTPPTPPLCSSTSPPCWPRPSPTCGPSKCRCVHVHARSALSDPVQSSPAWGFLCGGRRWMCAWVCCLIPAPLSTLRLSTPSRCAPHCTWLLQASVMGMMELKEFATFKQHVRDFLVQSNQFADQNNADLFSEEVTAQVGGRGAGRCAVLGGSMEGLVGAAAAVWAATAGCRVPGLGMYCTSTVRTAAAVMPAAAARGGAAEDRTGAGHAQPLRAAGRRRHERQRLDVNACACAGVPRRCSPF